MVIETFRCYPQSLHTNSEVLSIVHNKPTIRHCIKYAVDKILLSNPRIDQ